MRVCIISSRRPHAVKAMSDLGWAGTWFVGHGEANDYLVAGALDVVEAGSLIEARNRALDAAFATDDLCVQVSDDCTKVELWNGVAATPRPPAALIQDAVQHIDDNCRLVGVAPTANSFYADLKIKRRHFIVGDFFVAAPSSIRFDPELRLKEDYDYTAAHLAKFGEVARLDWWLVTFRHRKNKGGAVDYRTPELEQEAIAVLRRKWGGWIKPNPRRPNEVLLRPR